ncbi:MAG: hypothetical protein L3J21_00280 [Devosiaceae bacterium]|nr:hypothetical protein [Devosiaceae bacterium]
MTEQVSAMTKEQTVDAKEETRLKRQRMRSIAIALSLVAFVMTFFILTVVRMGPDLFVRPL